MDLNGDNLFDGQYDGNFKQVKFVQNKEFIYWVTFYELSTLVLQFDMISNEVTEL